MCVSICVCVCVCVCVCERVSLCLSVFLFVKVGGCERGVRVPCGQGESVVNNTSE